MANRANIRSGIADNDVAADAAFPHRHFTLFKHLLHLNVVQKLAIAFFMGLFNGGDQTELSSDFREAFFFGSLREPGVHIGPFVVFAFGCSLEIGCRVADAAQEIKPQTGMFLFVASGRQEDFRELFIAFAAGNFCKVRVLVAGLGFTGKCGGKVFCRLSALQAVVCLLYTSPSPRD